MPFAAVVEVDNSGEDPDEGRRGLREELAPAMAQLPGFVSGVFMTAYERGRGIGVVVLETRDQAEQLTGALAPGSEIRPGVVVRQSEVLEVSATAYDALKRRRAGRPRSLRTGRREEPTAEQAVVDGAQLDASLALPFVKCAARLERRQLVRVGLPAGEPRAGGRGELGREVDHVDVDEAGRRKQVRLVATGGDGAGTRPLGAPPLRRRQVGRNENRRVGDASAWSEQSFERSQHGELAAQSTQHVGVHDRIERPCPEGLVGTARGDQCNPIIDVLDSGAAGGDGECVDRHVGADERAAGSAREIEAWPAPSGADVEQAPARRQIE